MKTFFQRISPVLLVLAIAVAVISLPALFRIRPVSAYQDMGIHTFIPYQTYPTQRETTSSRHRRSTRTVYVVYYRSTGQHRYQWQQDASYEAEARRLVKDKTPVERRVLEIPEANKIVVLSPKQTAQSYVSKLWLRYGLGAGLSVLYILCYLSSVLLQVQRRRNARSQLQALMGPDV